MTEEAIRRLGAVDRGLYALFSRHADSGAHDRDRRRYRAAGLTTSFDVYVARVYGLAWSAGLLAAVTTVGVAVAIPEPLVDGVFSFLRSGLPLINRLPVPAVPRLAAGIAAGAGVGALVRWLVVRAGGVYLGRVARARRADIERTLPGAVRYLRVLASGSSDQREMLARVAEQDAYGATAGSFRAALNKAALTGSLDEGLSMVARETPSQDLFAPFLLKFREHGAQGGDSLESYLKMEGRLLSQRQARAHERASGYLELVAELFVVLLVFPALAVLILTVASALAPGLSQPFVTPLGSIPARTLLVYACVGFVLAVGFGASTVVASLRPTSRSLPTHRRPESARAVLVTATRNPASAAVVCLPIGIVAAGVLFVLDYGPVNTALLSYAAYGIPVGAVAVWRARRDDAKDREIQDFVHAVSGHVSLGRPFPEAVRRVAREVDLGALQSDVDDLAFSLDLTTGPTGTADVRAGALDQFVERVGTPLAAQTVGLVVGALEAGSDAEKVFETLETEIGRLYHERKELRSRLLVYVAVGWTTALLVVGIVVAVNASVLDGFAQLSSVSEASARMAFDPGAVDPARDRFRFYLVTQATVVACGWFAGTASRGRYEALLHSAALVVVTYVVFAGLGVV
ncbi:MAG: type II secretion system F family protein [Salinirussus sp.]